jgi:hypothetical protein
LWNRNHKTRLVFQDDQIDISTSKLRFLDLQFFWKVSRIQCHRFLHPSSSPAAPCVEISHQSWHTTHY